MRLRLRKEVLREIHELLETPPSEVSPECQYLLELDHSALYKATYEDATLTLVISQLQVSLEVNPRASAISTIDPENITHQLIAT